MKELLLLLWTVFVNALKAIAEIVAILLVWIILEMRELYLILEDWCVNKKKDKRK